MHGQALFARCSKGKKERKRTLLLRAMVWTLMRGGERARCAQLATESPLGGDSSDKIGVERRDEKEKQLSTERLRFYLPFAEQR
jgi:hypothetical protein